jgi:UDP-N-acetylmuramyl tripeptide synthase
MTSLLKDLATIQPAFGRGEKINIRGQSIELVLVKNPAGFRLSLASFVKPGHSYMIAINDAYADGRDMSWLWDVDFASLKDSDVAVISGVRAYDMALRLQYDEVMFAHVEPSIAEGLKRLIGSGGGPKVLFCSYTAMLAIREQLGKYADILERAL